MNKTSIGWTDYSVNPLKYRDASGAVVWACEKVSPGCAHCYSASLANRWGRGADFNAGEMAKLTPFLDEKELASMLNYKPASGKRCFVGDMTDVFGEWVSDALIVKLFATMALRPDVTFQVLTKRAARMARLIGLYNPVGGPPPFSERVANAAGKELPWPLPNVWLGVSCEDQQRADERIPELLDTPAVVRFISAEPLLADVGLFAFFDTPTRNECLGILGGHKRVPGLDWVIVGGESGANFRPCEREWIASIVTECESAGVPVFVKQGAHRLPGQPTGDPRLDALKQFPERGVR